MVIRSNRPFVYGQFFLGDKRTQPPSVHEEPRIAIEILREFSSTEFVGKLYVNAGNAGNWIPATVSFLGRYKWYSTYQKVRVSPLGAALLHFAMDGSGVWNVKFFRDESDETGPYLAVALKLRE